MRWSSKKNWDKPLLALAGFLAATALVCPAQARAKHEPQYFHPVSHPAPAAAPDSGFGPTEPGASIIVIDATNGHVLNEQGADVPRYPASLTKLMTLDLAFQALRDGRMTLDTQIPVSYHAASVEPVKLGLAPGSTISVHDAILAMTTMSANDAATALGEYLGGGSELRCSEMMTLRAHALGMAQTSFANASGLPNPNQVTTARDLSLLARDIVMNFPQDQGFFEVQNFNFRGHTVYSNNAMLKTYPGASGMKTGYTILARHNLVTSAVRNGRVLVGVVLHEPSWGMAYQQMTAMLDYGFGGGSIGNGAASGLTVASNQQPRPQIPQMVSAPPVNAAVGLHKPSSAPQPIQLASKTLPHTGGYNGSWIVQVGVYSHMDKARVEAIAAHQIRGVGIPRITKVQSHGKTLWTAQLAGLTQSAAHETCNVFASKGSSCRVIAPQTDHLAMRDVSAGG